MHRGPVQRRYRARPNWQAMASDIALAPGLDEMTMESDAPVQPDADGNYPIAMPGMTKVL